MSALDEKDLGTAAWKDGQYQKAIDHFSKAISLTEERDLLLVLHSNRSAAFLKLKQYTEAVQDGDKCIEIDPSWIKGYARKGDAFYANGELKKASAAYAAGLKKDPNDKTLLEKSEQLNASLSKASKARISGYLQTAIRVARYFMLVNVILFWISLVIPFFWTGFNRGCYVRASLAQVLLSLLALYNTHGFPKLKTEYLQALVLDPSTIRLFLAMILMLSQPYALAIASPFLCELSCLLPTFVSYIQQHLPLVEGQLRPLLSRFAPQLADQNLAALLSPAMVNQISFQLVRLAASAEVMQGVYLLVGLVAPTRNLMFTMIWWQYLQMRYMTDTTGHTKHAFSVLDQRISGVLTHRLCPQIANTGYIMLKQYLIKRVSPVSS